MNKQMIWIMVAGMSLAISALGEPVGSVNIVGMPAREQVSVTVTGRVAIAYSSPLFPGPLCQITGMKNSVVIRNLAAPLFDSPSPVDGAGVWMQVTHGRVGDVLVDGIPLALTTHAISNGVVRTKDFGVCRIYLYNGLAPAALLVDQLTELTQWLDTQKQGPAAEPQGRGYSPAAARPSKPTP